jgi:isopentenyl-diphosphate delta-isomerase
VTVDDDTSAGKAGHTVADGPQPSQGRPARQNRSVASGTRRKAEHLRINLEEDVSAKGITTGFEAYRFNHQALPELDLAAVDTTVRLFGRRLEAPLIISSMTGGIEQGGRLNRALAMAAGQLGLGLGVGSQRVALEGEDEGSFRVRDLAPDALLFANLGAVQLNRGFGVDECRRAVEMIEADALVLHLNPLQEALQPGGDTNFGGLARQIAAMCRALPVPVLVKEVGWGISAETARMLEEAGVAGIDVAGAGGTSWSEVEKHRAHDEHGRRVASTFAGWGIPTAESLCLCRGAVPGLPLIASGGIRTGIDIAKAIALGAEAAALAGPALRAALPAFDQSPSADSLVAFLRELIDELRITMFCTASPTLPALRRAGILTVGTSSPRFGL